MASRWTFIILGAVLACFVGGCATQNENSFVGPWAGERFQESPIQLDCYRSVQERPGGQDPNLAVAVSISGGGHRAGNFAAGVLWGLEEISPDGSADRNALREVDYLSTCSGGGLAAGAYISSLRDYQTFHGSSRGYSFARALSADGKSVPLKAQLTDPDLRQNLEYNYIHDLVRGVFAIATLDTVHRGDFLENSFDDHILGREWREKKLQALRGDTRDHKASLKLSDMFVWKDEPNVAVRLPYWVANATAYENAAIFAFAPDQIRLYQLCGYTHRLAKVVWNEARTTQDGFAADVPMSVGLTASGCFPVLIPAITMDSRMDKLNPYLHLIDGGVADNFGVTTAIRLLGQDKAAHRKALLVIDAFNGPLSPFSEYEGSPAAINAAYRAATGFLDAFRIRSHAMIHALCKSPMYGGDIEVVFLSLDDLEDCKGVSELEPFGFGQADLDPLRRDLGILGDEARPFVLARHVKTSFALSAIQQKLLLAAGRYVVHKKRQEIRKALGWTSAGG